MHGREQGAQTMDDDYFSNNPVPRANAPEAKPGSAPLSRRAKVILGLVALVVFGGPVAAELTDTDSSYSPVYTGTTSGTGSSSDSASCDFLRRSLADFRAPNPGPTTLAESQEVSEIQAEMSAEGC